MAFSQADATPEDTGTIPRPGWRRRTLHFLIDWWPVLFAGISATALASIVYIASAVAFKDGAPGYGTGFALFGLVINAIPPAIVGAAKTWIK